MSLHNNSDYEVISNAEIASVISKYSPDMIDMVLDEIMRTKSSYRITPIGNMITSYEQNFKIDMEKFPQFQPNMLEQRAELYMNIANTVCNRHNITLIDSSTDVFTIASNVYQFLISGFYEACITFFVNFLSRESDEICNMIGIDPENNTNPTHQYAKKRYGVKTSLSIIHTNLNRVLDTISALDINLSDIIATVYSTTYPEVGAFLNSVLVDNGDFYKNFYVPAVSGYNRADAVTNIRLRLMPISTGISEYIDSEN